LPIPIYLAVGIYNSLYYRTSGEQKHVTSHVFAETTHVVAEPCGFACVMRDRGRNRHGPKRALCDVRVSTFDVWVLTIGVVAAIT